MTDSLRPSLRPGAFYRSRAGDTWCCVRVDDRAPLPSAEHRRAACVRTTDFRVEWFHVDGRYDTAGERDHCLVYEVAP